MKKAQKMDACRPCGKHLVQSMTTESQTNPCVFNVRLYRRQIYEMITGLGVHRGRFSYNGREQARFFLEKPGQAENGKLVGFL